MTILHASTDPDLLTRLIPLELRDTPRREVRQNGQALETRAVTGAPGTVGVNLDPIYPQIFAYSIAPRLGIEMPEVDSGTYATATILSSVGGGAHAKGARRCHRSDLQRG